MAAVLSSIPDLAEQLEHIPGVLRAVIDATAQAIVLICEPQAARAEVVTGAGEVLSRCGVDADAIELEVAVRIEQRERVRFLEVSRQNLPDYTLAFRVVLEWNGRACTGEAITQRGEPLELKAVASATVSALAQVVEQDLNLRVSGVKHSRSFDAELMVAALYQPGGPPRQLIGAVVMGDDPYRAVCLAVLSALNRLLGNFLAR